VRRFKPGDSRSDVEEQQGGQTAGLTALAMSKFLKNPDRITRTACFLIDEIRPDA
jgi:hypothetical protein